MTVTENEKKVLRELAKRWREIADAPEMPIRKRQWRALHDLKPEKPMIVFESFWLDGYLADYKLRCENKALRDVELFMMHTIRHYEQMGDDIVVEPYYRLGWQGIQINTTGTDFGEIKVEKHNAKEAGLAFLPNFPVKTPDDIEKLSPRIFQVEKAPVLALKTTLEDIFGDVLPLRVGNYDNFDPDLGNQPFTGNFFPGITWDTFMLIGAEAMMLWPYDCPDALRKLLDFLVEDKKRFFKYMLDEGLLESNTDNQLAGPSCYGYVSDLPKEKTSGLSLKDLWGWSDSQETQMMGPELFAEFYLPPIAELARQFGLVYYGCCERVDQKMEHIRKAIPNIRIFSISGWTDVDAATEQMGTQYVASKKPVPAYVSLPTAEWDKVRDEAKKTWAACKRNNTPLEVICRDVYSSVCTPERAVEWVRTWKETIGI